MSTRFIEKIQNNNKNIKIFGNSKDNLRIISQQLDDLLEIDYNDKELNLKLINPNKIKKDLNIYLKINTTLEKTFLTLNEENPKDSFKWKFFLDENTKYTFFMKLMDNKGKLNNDIKMPVDYIKNFNELSQKTNEDDPIKFYKIDVNIATFESK